MDYTFTISGAFIGAVLITALGYLVKTFVGEKLKEMRTRRQAFESHIAFCMEKAKAFALLEQKVQRIDDQIEADKKTREWIGHCVVKIAASLNIQIPDWPS